MHKPLWLPFNLTKLILLGVIIALLMAFVASCGLSTGIPIASGQNNSTGDGGGGGDGGGDGDGGGGGGAPTITGKDIIIVQDMFHCNINAEAESHYTTTNYDANTYRVVSFITSVVNSSNPRSSSCDEDDYSDDISERFSAAYVQGSNISAPASNDKRVIISANRLLIEDEVYTVTLYIVGKNDFVGSAEQAEAASKALGTTPATFTVTAVDLPFTVPGVILKETTTTIGIGTATEFATKTIGIQSGYYDPDVFKIVPFITPVFDKGLADDIIIDVKETGASDITQDGIGSINIKATRVLATGNFYSVVMYVMPNDAPANTKTEAANSAILVGTFNPTLDIHVQ